MGIYIRGMEMPKNCGECKFFAWKRGVGQHCAVDDRITFHATIDGMDVAYERNGNCPLVPVPPHGRLIDADALEKDIDKYIGGEESRSRFHHWVQVQRTVMPESEEAHT